MDKIWMATKVETESVGIPQRKRERAHPQATQYKHAYGIETSAPELLQPFTAIKCQHINVVFTTFLHIFDSINIYKIAPCIHRVAHK